jgi:AraC-like DNA-binding protein
MSKTRPGTFERLRIPAELEGNVWFHPREPRLPRPVRSPHRHDELELNLVTSGTARYLIGGRAFDLNVGSSLWLFPDQDHVLLDESSGFRMWIVVWRPSLIRRRSNRRANRVLRERDPPGSFLRSLSAPETNELGKLCDSLTALTDSSPSPDAERYNLGLEYLLLSAWAVHQSAARIEGRDVHPSIREAVRWLRESPEPIDLVELANRAELSPSRLSRLFKRETGVTLVTFRQRVALERFLHAYDASSGRTLISAALSAGFGSYAQFYRVYKQSFGHGPGDRHRR